MWAFPVSLEKGNESGEGLHLLTNIGGHALSNSPVLTQALPSALSSAHAGGV